MNGLGANEKVSNRILNALPAATLERLRQHLTHETLPAASVLSRVGESIHKLHFIERDIEGVTSTSALLDGSTAILECVAQVPGDALAIDRDILRDEMARDPALNKILHAYQNVTISQLAQTAACNRLHTLEQRCGRWLLTAHDSAGTDTFELTHEFLSMMLGVRRPGVSVAMQSLQQSGIIRYSRGRITIVDRADLEQEACECYATVHEVIERLFAAVG